MVVENQREELLIDEQPAESSLVTLPKLNLKERAETLPVCLEQRDRIEVSSEVEIEDFPGHEWPPVFKRAVSVLMNINPNEQKGAEILIIRLMSGFAVRLTLFEVQNRIVVDGLGQKKDEGKERCEFLLGSLMFVVEINRGQVGLVLEDEGNFDTKEHQRVVEGFAAMGSGEVVDCIKALSQLAEEMEGEQSRNG